MRVQPPANPVRTTPRISRIGSITKRVRCLGRASDLSCTDMADPAEAFRSVCEEALHAETDVIDSLTSSAEKYLAAVGIALGFQVNAIGTAPHQNTPAAPFAQFLLILGPVILAAAVIVLLLSMRVRKYPTYAPSEDLRQLDPTEVDEQTINRSVGHLYLKMRDGIRAVNEQRAKAVRIALGLIISGFFATVAGQIILKSAIGG